MEHQSWQDFLSQPSEGLADWMVLPSKEDLHPEQHTVLHQVLSSLSTSIPGQFPPVVLVQGVAGSGKTTVSLSLLRLILEDYSDQLSGRNLITPTLVTYNTALLDACYHRLENSSIDSRALKLLGTKNSLEKGQVNLLTFTELCRKLLPTELHDQVCSDEECINLLRHLCARRGVRISPEQAFAYITSFLKSEALDGGLPQLKTLFEREELPLPKRDQDNLLQIAAQMFQAYQKKLADRFDRADLSQRLLREIRLYESYYMKIMDTTVEDLHRWATGHRHDTLLGKSYEWLLGAIKAYTDVPALGKEMDAIYERIENETNLQLGRVLWEQIQTALREAVSCHGFRNTPIFEQVGHILHNPIMLIDEVQDLCKTEVELIIRLWYHMPRNHKSRLLLFGDFNQMMTPTGFKWEGLFDIVNDSARCLMLPEPFRYERSKSFRDADALESMSPHSCFWLLNNYRTTDEIASFAREMMNDVTRKQIDNEKLRRGILKNVVDPERSLYCQMQDDIINLSHEERQPMVLAGDLELFKDELEYMFNQDSTHHDFSDTRLVIIFGGDEQLEAVDIKGRSVTLLPLLRCKGLEFSRVVILGLPIPTDKEQRQLDMDLLGQWYTGITRSCGLLMLFLSNEQLEFLQNIGWKGLNSPKEPKQVKELLRRWLPSYARVKVTSAAFTRSGDSYLQEFIKTRDERWLLEAIRAFQDAKNNSGVSDSYSIGAELFKEAGEFDKAIRYYNKLGDIQGEVECLLRLEKLDEAREKAHRYDKTAPTEVAEVWEQIWNETRELSDGKLAVQAFLRDNSLHSLKKARMITQQLAVEEQEALLRQVVKVAIDVRRGQLQYNERIELGFEICIDISAKNEGYMLLNRLAGERSFDALLHCFDLINKHPEGSKLWDEAEISIYLRQMSNSQNPIAGIYLTSQYLRKPVETAAGFKRYLSHYILDPLYEMGGFRYWQDMGGWWYRGFKTWLQSANNQSVFALMPDEFERLKIEIPDSRTMRRIKGVEKGELQRMVGRIMKRLTANPDWRERVKTWLLRTKEIFQYLQEILGFDSSVQVKECQDFYKMSHADLAREFLPWAEGIRHKLQESLRTFPYRVWSNTISHYRSLPEVKRHLEALSIWRSIDKNPHDWRRLLQEVWDTACEKNDMKQQLQALTYWAEVELHNHGYTQLVEYSLQFVRSSDTDELPELVEPAIGILFPEGRAAQQRKFTELVDRVRNQQVAQDKGPFVLVDQRSSQGSQKEKEMTFVRNKHSWARRLEDWQAMVEHKLDSPASQSNKEELSLILEDIQMAQGLLKRNRTEMAMRIVHEIQERLQEWPEIDAEVHSPVS